MAICLVFIIILFSGFTFPNSSSPLNGEGPPFGKVFLQKGTPIVLMQEQSLIGSLRALQVDSEGSLWCLDSKSINIKKYDGEGKLIKLLGRKGQGPGEFVRPLAFWIDDDNLLVGDPQARKLHVFDRALNFKRFFKIRDCREIRRFDTNTVILGAALKGNDDTGACLHMLDMKQGNIINSFFPITENALKNKMISDGVFLALDQKNNIYSIQEMEYKISKFNSSGKLLKEFGSPNPHYIAPPQKAFEDFFLRSKLTTWIKSWTHIYGLFVTRNHVIVQMIQFEDGGNSYLLDFYSFDGKPMFLGIQSQYRMLNVDSSGILYFLKEDQESESQLSILKFSIKGKL
jgi:hypothetical protein